MSKSDKFRSVIKAVVSNLLMDITSGHGNDYISIPREDENTIIPMKNCIHELAKFWGGNQSITKFELFAAILQYCSNENTVLDDITTLIVDKYPDNEARLTSDCIQDTILKYYGSVVPVEIHDTPIVENETEQPKNKATTAKTSHIDNSYKEMCAARNDMAKQRVTVAVANGKR